MNLIDILMLKFPDADFLYQIQVGDDGSGQRIVLWDYNDLPIPDQEDIDQWRLELQSEYDTQQSQIKFDYENREILDQLDKIDQQSIRALRTNDTVRLNSLEQQAVILRQQLKRV